MQFGVCQWIYGGEPLATTVERLARYGYDGIELGAEPEQFDFPQVKRMLDDHGLAVLGLTPAADWPTETRDLASPDPARRTLAIDYAKSCVDMAAELDAVYAGVLPVPSGRHFGLSSYADEWKWAVEGVQQVGEYAESVGKPAAVEVLNRYESYLLTSVMDGLRFVEDVGCDSVRLLLDLFHLHLEEADLHAALRAAARKLGGLHLADTNRLGLGWGHLDLTALFHTLRAIGYDGTVNLEFTAPGPNPFEAIKDEQSLQWLDTYTRESIVLLRAHEQVGL